jgi:hypothetical protein
MLSPALLRSLTRWRRRVSVAALLVLHVLIAGSELFDPVGEVRLDTHAEQHGNKHPFAHDATTCAVCSVQMQTMDVPPTPPPIDFGAAGPVGEVRPAASGIAAAQFQPVASRAPPSAI